jgi:4-amino-4-deoxy-L-arabinose transferase-like glycosyltransferase
MRRSVTGFAAVGGAWLVLLAIALASRPLLPVDETRYLTVAWEMHQSGDWLVPHLNGETYSHKPPLLFWLINLGWLAFGVSETWGRLVAPLFGLGTLALTGALARLLWPEDADRDIAGLAPLILLGAAWWMLFSTLTYFDTLLAFFAVAGMIGLVLAARGRPIPGFLLFGTAVGFGVLAKGPAVLVHVLPVALLAPLWARRLSGTRLRPWPWARWYVGVVLGLVLGAALALAWAFPAAKAGGPAYGNAILWGQTAGRMRESFAHSRPFWWYLPLLPALFFPWLVWPPLLRAVAGLRRGIEPALRLCLIWFGAALLVFSLVSGKQPHYLVPEFAPFALFLARGLRAGRDRLSRRDQVLPAATILLLGLVLTVGPLLLDARPDLVVRWQLPAWSVDIYEEGGLVLVALAIAVLAVRTEGRPGRNAAVVFALPASLFAVAHLLGLPAARETVDLAPAAVWIRAEEDAGKPLAYAGEYHGEFHFLGRLRRPFEEIDYAAVPAWLASHPDGRVIARYRKLPSEVAPTLYRQPVRGRTLVVWGRESVAADPQAFAPR